MTILFAAIPGLIAQEKKEPEKKRGNERIEGKTLFEWENDLKDRDPAIREKAIAVLKVYGPDASDAAPSIIRAVTDKDISIRVNAIITLGFIGQAIQEKDRDAAVRALMVALRDYQGIVRYQAARAVARFQVLANAAVPSLRNLLHDQTTWEIRAAAAHALGQVGWIQVGGRFGYDRVAFSALTNELEQREDCAEVRVQVLQALLVLGTPAQPNVKADEERLITRFINDKHKKISIWARMGLMRLNDVSEAHLGAITRFLRDPEPDVRYNAALALATVGPGAKAHAGDVLDALNDKDPRVVMECCSALAYLGDKSEKVVQGLQNLSNDTAQSDIVRAAAKAALESLTRKPAPGKQEGADQRDRNRVNQR
jgi:HEAT repeat protein